MASMVEFIEALTIVLAVGVVRGWRAALLGSGAAIVVLAALVAALGPTLTRIPLPAVQLVVGTLLLLFGLRWLRKAVLRAAGVLPLHDESAAFAQQTAALHAEPGAARRAFDKLAFATTFKSVLLEGLEVVFIVIAIGAGGLLLPAVLGAVLALLLVIGLGLWLHRPLARVPENALKFGVGVLLSAFGTFWVGEGIGLGWPGGDWALLALIAAFLVVAGLLITACARLRRRATPTPPRQPARAVPAAGPLALLGAQLLGLFVDDGWLAVATLLWVAAWLLARHFAATANSPLFGAGLALALALSAMRRAAR